METMQPTLRIGRNVWDQINLPKIEFEQRVEKIRKRMEKEDINLLLVYSNALNDYGNTCYISNYVMMVPRGPLVAVPQNGEVTLFFEGSSRMLSSAKTTTWMRDVRACADISQECVRYLEEKNFIPSNIGFVSLEEFMPYHQFKFLTDAVSQCQVVDARHIILDLRMVKSVRECDQIRRSARIVRHVFDVIASTRYQNMNEKAFEAMIYREGRLEGAEDIRMLIAKPQEVQWALRPTEDATIMSGQSIIVYLAVGFERYWAEGIRTFVAKDNSFTDVDIQEVKTLYEGMVSSLKPGKRLGQCHREIMNEIQKSEGKYISEYGLGQGIGLSLRELPIIAGGESRHLKDGMCFSLRLAIEGRTRGVAMIGNTIHISKEGPEVLIT